MTNEDSDNNYGYSDEEVDQNKHQKIIDNVINLSKVQQVKKPSRTEPTLQISEFNLVRSVTGRKGSIHVNELAKTFSKAKTQNKLSVKKVEKTTKNLQPLPKPLEKPQAERIRRGLSYEKTRLELDRWEAFVESGRAAASVTFPLNQDKGKMDHKEIESFTKFRLKSKLEQELEKLEPKVEEFHIETEDKAFPLTMSELMEKRKETAKLRAHQSYQESKARRQNKIKSKKFHRVQKREKIKKQLKDFELLQRTDPEAALKKLEDIDKTRAEERFSLRHRSTGKWAKSKQIRAKYDKESRQVLAEQLTISRDLTKKVKPTDSDDEMAENENNTNYAAAQSDPNNPWTNGLKADKEVTDFVGNYRKFWNEKNQEINDNQKNEESKLAEDSNNADENENNLNEEIATEKLSIKQVESPKKKRKLKEYNSKPSEPKKTKAAKAAKQKKSKNDLNVSTTSTSDWDVSTSNITEIDTVFDKLENTIERRIKKKHQLIQNKLKRLEKLDKKPTKSPLKTKKKIDLSLPNQSKRPQIDEELLEVTPRNEETTENSDSLNALKDLLNTSSKDTPPTIQKTNIDPNKFIKVKTTHLKNAIPDILETEDNEENIDQRQIISEAFEDDDIVQDFTKEKKDEIDKDKPKDIDLTLPGWGSWGGTNIKINKRKKRRFIIKMPEVMPRRDDNKGSLIINEKGAAKIKEHMVSEVPFPFKSVKDFEASVRAPIGNTFVTESAFKRLTRPAVITQMGAIIEPVTKDALLNKKKK